MGDNFKPWVDKIRDKKKTNNKEMTLSFNLIKKIIEGQRKDLY